MTEKVADHVETGGNIERPDWADRVAEHVVEPCLIVGCGKGTFLDEFEEIVGVDFFRDATLQAAQVRPGRVCQGEASELPFKPAQFQSILMVHSLEHFPRPLDAVEEAHRVLEPGGKLYIEVPNSSNYVHERRGHLYGWTKRLLSNLLHRAGFDDHEVEYIKRWGSIVPGRVVGNNATLEHALDMLHNILFPNNFRRVRARAFK